MKITILIKIEDNSSTTLIVSQMERANPLNAATLGLTLAESKQLLARVQQEFVESQLHCHAQEQRICAQRGGRRAFKDYRPACFKSLFGRVVQRVPRLYGCACEGQHAQ